MTLDVLRRIQKINPRMSVHVYRRRMIGCYEDIESNEELSRHFKVQEPSGNRATVNNVCIFSVCRLSNSREWDHCGHVHRRGASCSCSANYLLGGLWVLKPRRISYCRTGQRNQLLSMGIESEHRHLDFGWDTIHTGGV